jgi:hypothetical protein
MIQSCHGCAPYRGQSTLEVAESYFKQAIETGCKRILNTDLHTHVCRVTGQHRSVVHGTLDSSGPGSLYSAAWYLDNWHKELRGSRVIHVFGEDTKEEKESVAHLQAILTLVKPDELVITADIDSLQLYALHPNVKAIGVYEAPEEKCKLFNANTGGGYASKKLVNFLRKLDSEQMAEVIALTVLKLDNFRNTGEFQDLLRDAYCWSTDKHVQCISDQLENYEMVDRFVFRRKENSMPLETLVFQRL